MRYSAFAVCTLLFVSNALLAQRKSNDFGGATPIHPESWIRNSDYPVSARREHRTGLVRFAFDINASGKVENCAVTLSSGSQDLDDAPCQLLARRGHFKMPIDEQGNPMPTKGHSQVNWKL